MNSTSLDSFTNVQSLTFVVIIFIAEVYVFAKVRMRLDGSMITIALAFLISFIFRTDYFNKGDLDIVQALASMTIWGIMFFFVF